MWSNAHILLKKYYTIHALAFSHRKENVRWVVNSINQKHEQGALRL
jgi:hypothetical protein